MSFEADKTEREVKKIRKINDLQNDFKSLVVNQLSNLKKEE